MSALPKSSPEIESLPGFDAPRAKVLRPSDRRRVDVRTEKALSAFEEVATTYEPTPEATSSLRRAAAVAMRELRREHDLGTLPPDLAAVIEKWIDGEFSGTAADIEIANHALVDLLGSETIVDDYRLE